MKENGGGIHTVEFSPKVVGEHKIMINYRGVAIAGSPFKCKVYDCKAIKVKNVDKGVVGKPVTFLGKSFSLRFNIILKKKNLTVIIMIVNIFLWYSRNKSSRTWKFGSDR